jgi:hypothetical protein
MRKSIVLAFLLIFLAGCYTGDFDVFTRDKELLRKTASAYYNMLMWKYYDKASVFVDPDKKEEFERFTLESQDRLNITSYELKEVVFNPDRKNGSVRVAISYYKYPSVSEKTVLLEDPWILRGGKWYIHSDFKDEMFK